MAYLPLSILLFTSFGIGSNNLEVIIRFLTNMNYHQIIAYVSTRFLNKRSHACNCHIRVVEYVGPSFSISRSQLASLNLASTKGSSGAHLSKMIFEPGLARGTQSHFWRECGCGKPRKPSRSHERRPYSWTVIVPR